MDIDAIAAAAEFEGSVTAEQFELLMEHVVETLIVLGNIEGLMIFFAVVLLCYFIYKFFRMFF